MNESLSTDNHSAARVRQLSEHAARGRSNVSSALLEPDTPMSESTLQAPNDHVEIVLVTTRCALLDEHFHERVYWRRDGVPLAGGYYLVSWPAGTEGNLFDENASFRGPFRTRVEARAAMPKSAACSSSKLQASVPTMPRRSS